MICLLLLSSSVAFAATHTVILKVTNPNSSVSDAPVLNSDGDSWTQVYVEIPAKLYMDKGWLDSDLDNLRFLDVDNSIYLSHWVAPKADNNLRVNHLGVWLLVKGLTAGETETIKMEMVDGASFFANPRATEWNGSVGVRTHDRTAYNAAATVFPFYGYDSWEWKWRAGNPTPVSSPGDIDPYASNVKFADWILTSEDDYDNSSSGGDPKSGDFAKTGNEFTITIHNMKFYAQSNSAVQIYFLSQLSGHWTGGSPWSGNYVFDDDLQSSDGYRLYLSDYTNASTNLHYTRYQYTIKLQQYNGTGWDTVAETVWRPYNNSRHFFDIKVSADKIFLVINGQQFDFTAVGAGTVSAGKYNRSDSLTSGYFGYDRMTWRACCGSDINYFTVRRFLEQEPDYEVYGNTDLIISDTDTSVTLGQDENEIYPDLQQLRRTVDGNSLDDYIFATYSIARTDQIVDSYQVELKNRGTAAETFTWNISNSAEDMWIAYYCDSSGNNCTRTAPSTETLTAGSSHTYKLQLIPTLSALVNGSTAHLDLRVVGSGDGSFDAVRFSVSTLGNLGCFWEYKAKQIISWPGGHGYNNLLDYQVPISISGIDPADVRTDGADIVITDDNNSILDFWVKSYDSTTGELKAWVKVPEIDGSASNTDLYVWWGNNDYATSRSSQQATFDLWEDWQNDYADADKVGCDDGTTLANVDGDGSGTSNATLQGSSCQGEAIDPHGWENVPTPDDYYNWWEVDTIDNRRILQADVSSSHKSSDKGPFLHKGGLGWDHYEVAYKFYSGTYYQYSGGGTFGNPQYNAVYFNDAGNMWGMEYFADKFIFRPYAAGIDYTWQYQSYARGLLGSRFPQNDRWYVAKVRIFKDKSSGQSHLKLYFSDPEEDPTNLPDVDSNSSSDFTEVADFIAPPAFALDYGGIAFGGWDSGFGFDDIRVRKYTEDATGSEPVVTNSTVTTNTPRDELTLASPKITAPIFSGRPAYVEIKATAFAWRGDFTAYYADCYINDECQTGENSNDLGTISIFGQVNDDTPKGAGYYLMDRDPGDNNPTTAAPAGRTIYTTDGSSTSLIAFDLGSDANNDNISDDCIALAPDLGTIGTCDSTDGILDQTEKLIRFVRGYYVDYLDNNAFSRSSSRNFDADTNYGNDDGVADPEEQWKLADALHSDPLMIGVPNMAYGYPDYWSDFVENHDDRDMVSYFMTNDGMLHAIRMASIDTNTSSSTYGNYVPESSAEEIWAFIPHGVLGTLINTTDSEHEYVADGLLRAIDIKVDTGDGQGEIWRSVLFGIGGRENTYVFGMDVTDPDNPSLLWEMDADTASRIGMTTSAPALGRIDSDNDGTLDKWVAVVGSGYDPDYLANYETSTAWLTVINLADGTIIKQVKVSDKIGNVLTNMAVLRNAQTAKIEKLYFGDYYGCLWRITGERLGRTDGSAPLPNGSTLDSITTDGNAELDLLYKPADYSTAVLPDQPDCPITAQPRVATGTNGYWVYFGTGDYDEYDASYPYQAFFGLKDRSITSGPYVLSDLASMTSSSSNNATSSSWYIELGHNDAADYINNTSTGATSTKTRNERVMKVAEVYGGLVFFTTYEPINTPCGGGVSRFYTVDYTSGKFKTNLFMGITDSSGNSIGDVRSLELETGGVPSQPMILEGQSGSGTAVATGVTTSSTGGIEKIELDASFFNTALDILLWREKR